MKKTPFEARSVPLFATLVLILQSVPVANAASPAALTSPTPLPANTYSVDVLVTNRIPRFITNVVEVRIPMNVFRDEYRTNWVVQIRTNTIDVYKTNSIYQALTNTVMVQVTRTNWETALIFKTNWVTRVMTNTVEISLPEQAGVLASAQTRPEAVSGPRAQSIAEARGLLQFSPP